VLATVDGGQSREEVANNFAVSVPTIKHWLKRRRKDGNVEYSLTKTFALSRLANTSHFSSSSPKQLMNVLLQASSHGEPGSM